MGTSWTTETTTTTTTTTTITSTSTTTTTSADEEIPDSVRLGYICISKCGLFAFPSFIGWDGV